LFNQEIFLSFRYIVFVVFPGDLIIDFKLEVSEMPFIFRYGIDNLFSKSDYAYLYTALIKI